MKNNQWLPFVWAAFVVVFLVALFSIIQEGHKYIGKNYLDTKEFKVEINSFYEYIGPTVLNPMDPVKMKEQIPVTQWEIEEHRTRYGSLAEQIESIQNQYEHEIEAAESVSNDEVTAALKKERDTKIADIQQNFEDDDHVATKIRAEKSKVIDRYMESLSHAQRWSIPVSYQFKDVETGETYSVGSIDVPAAYKKTFNEKNGYFRAGSILSDEAYGYEVQEVIGISNSYARDEVVREVTGSHIAGETFRLYEGTVIIPKEAMKEGYLGVRISEYNKTKMILYALWICGLISLLIVLLKFRFNQEWVTENGPVAFYHRLKIDTKIIFLLISFSITFSFIQRSVGQYGYYFRLAYTSEWVDRAFIFTLAVLALVFTVFQLVNLIERWKDKEILKQELNDSYMNKVWTALREMFLTRSIGVQTIILLVGVFLAGFGLLAVLIEPYNIVVYVPAALFVGLPVLYILLRRTAYLNRIMKSTEAMAQGRLHEEIRVEGKSPLAAHAVNLNNLREGVRTSMTEQAKSERLKTELITNVSHDLRTPLTSIITYTDLLKADNLSDEERLKYVDILDKKSQRLKTLIEDLFEVSKMASGNLELHKQRVDLTQLLQQALAEHEEEVSESGLDFRASLPEVPLVALVDGQRWWRVLDNLIVNAIKYSLPGTRVYITLREVGSNAEFILKNITKYELGENVDELFERFKRADTSRHTDGSGLGLAIAQSIVDMHDGKMDIAVDGDLFKVSVTVPMIF